MQNEQQQVLDLTNVEEYDDDEDEDEGGASVVEITPIFQPVNANLASTSQQTQQPNPVPPPPLPLPPSSTLPPMPSFVFTQDPAQAGKYFAIPTSTPLASTTSPVKIFANSLTESLLPVAKKRKRAVVKEEEEEEEQGGGCCGGGEEEEEEEEEEEDGGGEGEKKKKKMVKKAGV